LRSFAPCQLDKEIPVGLAWLLGSVMECKGRQQLLEVTRPEVLKTLRRVAMIQSAESSNRIEGVTVARERLEPLVLGRVRPRDRSEEEIVGYRRALDWIHCEHEQIEVSPATLRQLHAMAQEGHIGDAGEWKRRGNDIIEVLPDGRRQIRFKTVSAAETPEAVDQLCLAFGHTVEQGLLPPLLAGASLVFDFLCIHPFRDGNGRVSRLLTLLVLYHHGVHVGRFISLERTVEESKQAYYDALLRSSQGWHTSNHDIASWWSYYLSTIRSAYRELEQRIDQIGSSAGVKSRLVLAAIDRLPASFTLNDVADLCPSVSKTHIRNILRRQRDEGRLETSSHGRGARWYKLQGSSNDR
jgi:Fic family protein